MAKRAGYIFRVACNNILQEWAGGSGLVVVLSLSSVPEATGSHVHEKNIHVYAAGVFTPNILSSDHSLFF